MNLRMYMARALAGLSVWSFIVLIPVHISFAQGYTGYMPQQQGSYAASYAQTSHYQLYWCGTYYSYSPCHGQQYYPNYYYSYPSYSYYPQYYYPQYYYPQQYYYPYYGYNYNSNYNYNYNNNGNYGWGW